MILSLVLLLQNPAWVIEDTGLYQPIQLGEAIVDSRGHTYVLDFAEAKIHHYSQQGDVLPSFGGKGKGPGEFTFPMSLFVDSKNVFVYDFLEGQLHKFNLEGKFDSKQKLPTRNIALSRVSHGWLWGTWGVIARNQAAGMFFSKDGFEEQEKLLHLDQSGYSEGSWRSRDRTGPVGYFSRMATHPLFVQKPDGGCYLAIPQTFRILEFDAKGKQVREIVHEIPLVPFDEDWGQEDLGKFRNETLAWRSEAKIIVNSPEHFPAIRNLALNPDGQLTVQLWSHPDSDESKYITLDKDGNISDSKWTWAEVERLAGSWNGHGVVTTYDDETGQAGLVLLSLDQVKQFIEGNPIIDMSSTRYMSTGG